MAKRTIWGGDTELSVTCEIYNVNIVVFNEASGTFREMKPDAKHSIYLSYGNDHYTALIPKHKQIVGAPVKFGIIDFGYAFNGKLILRKSSSFPSFLID